MLDFSGSTHHPTTDAENIIVDCFAGGGGASSRRFATVTIGGETFVIVDIGMRMLTPRELYTAQGFPSDYVIDGVFETPGDETSFTPFAKKTQISCVGNSACPDIAAALIRANCTHLIEERKAA